MYAFPIAPINGQSSSASPRQRRLHVAIAEYLQSAHAGDSPDRREFLERHWDVADGLLSFFADEDSLKRRAGLARPLAGLAARAESFKGAKGSSDKLPAAHDFGEFELLNEIAHGGMGTVYKARHKRLDRVVALKTIEPELARPSDEMVSRLRQEAKLVAALDHPNIVPLYEIGERGGYPYLVFKLVPCGDLERHARRLSRNPRAAARVVAKVARTVHYAHRQGVLHCDLKPSNILLDPQGAPHVTDFGLARCVGTESGLSRTGLAIGTLAYMAPEQVLGCRREMTVAVDVYGLGAVLYKLLAGQPPFREPDSIREHNPLVDAELEAICLKCLENKPARRYPSAVELAADLERWCARARRSAQPPCRPQPVARWYDQNRIGLALAAALAALVTTFALTAVGTASIICHYWLAEETARPVRRTVEISATAVAPADATLKTQVVADRAPGR
jgi:eukaryotic-like serine/threonine-protein kinase